ncbi:helix-turn-helix domain-containing protein [Micromonospora sp. NBRC 110038]|uniref:helix-turn-helix domain-containing protein n=1 Tax=Micromonospora sp. NBRC 110038 TaxID=1550034 RepID=UPI00210563B4|nr:helix-turn-helix domain-containing protein [Micromonospora sp. NBRC 110038]
MSGRDEVPIGRRMAELRARRGMSQQVFADRIGKSKSWVDKVERGVRTLDRLSVIETVAAALGVTPTILLTGKPRRESVTDTDAAVERIRAALARHDPPGADADSPTARQLDDRAGHAWAAYRNGHHAQVLRALPDLLAATRHTTRAEPAADPPVRVYRLTAQTLVKLGQPHLAWLAADRAMTAATGDPHRTALAAVSLAQALRALHRGRLAQTAALTAVHQLAPAAHDRPPDPGLAGTLLLEAALAAASYRDAATAHDLTERAAHLAAAHDGHHQGDGDGIAFGSAAVTLARALVATHLGDHHQAVTIHGYATSGDSWHQLPAEHRAAHLIDIARAHLDLGDPRAAGRALIAADQIAPAEARTRPVARAALTAIVRTGLTAADVARLAATVGLTRQ